MNVFAPFSIDMATRRIIWVNHTEKVKTLFESILIHTNTTRLELQNRFFEKINDNFFVNEKRIFVHLSRKMLNLTFEEISELINLSKTSVHNLFSSPLSQKDSQLLEKIESTYSNLLN